MPASHQKRAVGEIQTLTATGHCFSKACRSYPSNMDTAERVHGVPTLWHAHKYLLTLHTN